jgi:hypothetical protein
LNLKLNIQVSPRTVGKYLRRDHPVRTPDPKQSWRTFIRNHAKVMVACDFFVVITAAFRLHHRRDQIPSGPPLQRHVASHGGMDAAAVPRSSAGGHPYRFVIYDRHRIFSEAVDQGLSNLGVRVLRTPCEPQRRTQYASEWAAAFVASVWTFLIPFNERHLQMTVRDWAIHYNHGPYCPTSLSTSKIEIESALIARR